MSDCTLYFVETQSRDQRLLLCRWAERFYEGGSRVQVFADSTMAAQHLDQLLWTFAEGSFVPHRIFLRPPDASVPDPVILTVGEVRMREIDVLLCDGNASLNFMMQYPAAVLFVLRDDEEKRQESRLLWQEAKDRGLRLHHLPLASNLMVPSLRRR